MIEDKENGETKAVKTKRVQDYTIGEAMWLCNKFHVKCSGFVYPCPLYRKDKVCKIYLLRKEGKA